MVPTFFVRIRLQPRVFFVLPRPLASHPAPRRAGGGGLKASRNFVKMQAGRFGFSEGASRSGGCLVPNTRLCWIGRKHVLEFVFFVAAHGTPGHLAYFEKILDCRFCCCTQEILPVDVLVDGIFVAVYGTPGHFAYFETTLICIFCRCTQCSWEFGILRNDLGLQILSLCTELRGIYFTFETTSKRAWIADFVAIRRVPAHDLGLQIMSLYTGLRGILLSSKLPWIAHFVAIRRVPAHFAYFETTLESQILSLYMGLCGIVLTSKRRWIADFVATRGVPSIWLTSKRPWIADFVAVHGTPGHVFYFETTLDGRFCRCVRDSGAFGLLRNDI
jgi:hypothetical protein